MTRHYFGTDGIRGKVGEYPITPDFMLKLGYAAGQVLAHENQAQAQETSRSAVLIGKDTRISGYMLEAGLEAGFSAAGVDVVLAGPMPTPAIAYLTRALRLSAGVVISASHNVYTDNGIKFFSSTGNKLPDSVELEIESRLNQPIQCVASQYLGKVRRLDDAAGRYIEFCKSTFPAEYNLRGLRMVLDCANGAAYHVAPHVFHELGAEVIVIGDKPNGLNINDQFGATSPEVLAQAVRGHQAHIGIALDGDADRVLIADQAGRLYNGDELLYVLTQDRLAMQKNVEGVVGTLMTNLAIEQAIQSLGVQFVRSAVGDRYVLEQLLKNGWQLGAEGSGHILSLDQHTTGDGIISALLVLLALKHNQKTLADLLQGITLYPQKLINVRLSEKFDWKNNQRVMKTLQEVESLLQQSGRVLLRASGTEPVLRIMVEAKSLRDVEQYAQQIAQVLHEEMESAST